MTHKYMHKCMLMSIRMHQREWGVGSGEWGRRGGRGGGPRGGRRGREIGWKWSWLVGQERPFSRLFFVLRFIMAPPFLSLSFTFSFLPLSCLLVSLSSLRGTGGGWRVAGGGGGGGAMLPALLLKADRSGAPTPPLDNWWPSIPPSLEHP